jgi:hypothetical protein
MITQGINLPPPKQLLISFSDNRHFFSNLVYRKVVLECIYFLVVIRPPAYTLLTFISILYVYSTLQVQSLQTLLILWVPLPNVKEINFFTLNLRYFFFLLRVR